MGNFDDTVKKQEENDGKVQVAAVTAALERMEKDKAERESYEVQRRLESANQIIEEAARDGRFASKNKNILKKYSDDMNNAVEAFKATGDYKAYDEARQKIASEKDEALAKAKKDVYGKDAWRY
jgi:transposase